MRVAPEDLVLVADSMIDSYRLRVIGPIADRRAEVVVGDQRIYAGHRGLRRNAVEIRGEGTAAADGNHVVGKWETAP